MKDVPGVLLLLKDRAGTCLGPQVPRSALPGTCCGLWTGHFSWGLHLLLTGVLNLSTVDICGGSISGLTH